MRITTLAAIVGILLAVFPVEAATVIIDNADSGFSVLNGTSWTSTTAPGQWFTDCISQNTSDVVGQVEWRPDIPTSGQYEVAVWIPATPNVRPADATYTVHHADGTAQFTIDQNATAVQWVVLGAFNFNIGNAGYVTLNSTAQPDTRIVADAVKFSTGSQMAPEFRAFWASTGHEGLENVDQIDDMVSRAMQGNYNVINALIMYKQDTGGSLHGALWNSSILPKATAYPPEIDPLAHLIERAHANGLKVHGRLIPYTVSQAWPPAGNTILAANPQWLCSVHNDMGKGPSLVSDYYFLDPGSPEVQEYIISIVRELVTNYEIDGIHWDFIRHLRADSGYPSDNTYSNSTLARFRAITGRSDIPVPGGDAEWDDFRRRTIDELVLRSRAEIASIRTNPVQPVSLTAAVAGWGAAAADFENTSAFKSVFQNWEKWMRLGWLDGACPMIYLADHIPDQQTLQRAWVERAIGWRYQRHMYIGQCLYRNSMPNSIIQMQYGYDQGADGSINFAYGLTVDNDLDGNPETDWTWYPYLAENLFNEPAPIPELTWRTAAAEEGTIWGRITDEITGNPIDDATVTVSGQQPVQTDGNGYYVATMIPTAAGGTSYQITAEHYGYISTSGLATVLAGDVVRLDMGFDTSLPPVIAAVDPGPQAILVDHEHVRQLTLQQGTAQPWTLIEGPPRATISPRGFVSGWVATQGDVGEVIGFTARAENPHGSDEVSWQVTVEEPPPCQEMILADFEGYANGTEVLFRSPRYSGSTKQYLETTPDEAEVTDEVSPFNGSACYKVNWQFLDSNPSNWLRLTTSNAPYIPNPTLELDQAVRVRMRVDEGRFRLALGIRETGTAANTGADGGTVGDIEWVGASAVINDVPQGILVEPMPGVWQTVTFNPLTDPLAGMTGDGVLTGFYNKGTLEQLAFTAVDTAGPFTVYLDGIELLCDVPPTPEHICESRDVTGDVTLPPVYTEYGAWTNSTIKSSVSGLTGTGSRFINYELPNTGTDNATFVPHIDTPGKYEVFTTWAAGANCYDAKYTMRHYHGQTVQLVDQISTGAPEPTNCNRWISLGEYWFTAGQNADTASINVSEETVSGKPSPGWGNRVYADAVKLTLLEPWPDGDYTGEGDIDLKDFAYWSSCTTGPAKPYDIPRCRLFDFDLDNDIDLTDFAHYLLNFNASSE